MANTFDSSLVVPTLSDTALTVLAPSLAPIAGVFTTDFSSEVSQKGTSIIVPIASVASTVGTDVTDFETSGATLDVANVTLNQYTAAFQLSNTDINNGKKIEHLARIHLDAMAKKMKGLVNALITTAYTNTAVTVVQASFAAANATALRGSLKGGKRSLVLDGPAFSNLLPTNQLGFSPDANGAIRGYGFDGIYEDCYWTGVGVANTYGFVATPEAMAIASRLPEAAPAGAMLSVSNVTLPNGIVVQQNVWYSTKSRSYCVSFDVLLGAKRADVTALTYIKSA